MPNPREALTKAEPDKKASVRSLTPAEEDALSQITALTQPYMLTIRAGARSMCKATELRRKKRVLSDRQTSFIRSSYYGEAGSCGKPRAVTAARANC